MAWESSALMASSIVSMAYVYYGVMNLPRGVPRLLALLPIFAFNLVLPATFSTVFERGMLSFFFVWLMPFKLALLCWDAGPAADPWAVATFPRFISVMTLSLHLKRGNLDRQGEDYSAPASEKIAKQVVVEYSGQNVTDSELNGSRSSIVRRIPGRTRIKRETITGTGDKPATTGTGGTFVARVGRGERKHRLSWVEFLDESQLWQIVALRLIGQFLLLACFTSVFSWRHLLPHWAMCLAYSLFIYIACSAIFEGLALVVSPALGVQLEPQFIKPFLSDSLSDFWGRRWNLLVNNLMRVAVYEPILALCLHKREKSSAYASFAQGQQRNWNGTTRVHGKRSRSSIPHQQDLVPGLELPGLLSETEKDSNLRAGMDGGPQHLSFSKPPVWARTVAVLSVFTVSGLMHELIFFYMTLSKPTWEVTAFFILHGISTALEVALRRRFHVRCRS